ncbi:Glycosyl hydrolase catalytic core domain containing protein [Amanita muscaria]
MSAFKLINLLLFSSLALLANLGPNTVNALSIDSTHLRLARHVHHDAIALHKRDNVTTNTKRCKSRPAASPAPASPSPSPSPSPAPAPQHAASPSPAPSPSPSPAPAPAPSTSGYTSNGGGKVGIAYPLSDAGPLKFFKTNKVSYVYTWSPWCPEGAAQLGYACAPMLWGWKQVSDFQRLVVKGYASHVLGPNEPNQDTQSAISPQDGANMWRTYIDPLKDQGYKLISPACTNAPSGIKWMQDFHAACQGCTVDRHALHWYGINYQDMIDYLVQYHTAFPNQPIWVTEFACQDFSGQNRKCPNVWEFMAKVQSFMDNTPWIEAYFAFGVMYDMYNVDPANQLLGGNGQPNSLGYYYINN